MKMNKEVKTQILKNRSGPTMTEPQVVFADGEAYIVRDEDSSFGSPAAAVQGGSLGDLFSGDGLEGFGF
jgi:hypothetical protein